MTMLLRALILVSLATAGAAGPGVASAGSVRAGATGPWNSQGSCIRDQTNLPAAPSVAGDQFVVRSLPGDEAAAAEVASLIRSYNGHNIFTTYEQGLGLTSLLQPGQPKPFPVFIEHGALQKEDIDGVFAPLCQHPNWGSLIVDATVKDKQEMHDTVAHELFHAAQFALLKELTTGSNWWFEATATAAESWFGAQPDESGYEDAVLNHPNVPMDSFKYLDPHQYGAFLFVQWLLQTDKMPTTANWKFLKDSILKVREKGPTPGVEAAVSGMKVNFADEIASFWADHTNQLPIFGPKGKINKANVNQPYQQFTANPAKPLGARLGALVPAAKIQQVELQIENVPSDVELWVRLEEKGIKNKKFLEAPASSVSPTPDLSAHIQPGGAFDALFCRSGYANSSYGSYQLPTTGDIRLALTTTGKTAPPSFDYNVFTSTKPCPKPIIIVPGFEVGPLHLGMTEKEAAGAAKVILTQHYTYGGVTVDIVTYEVDAADLAGGYFLNGRLEGIGTFGLNFTTTTGIHEGLAASLRGQLLQSANGYGGATCQPFGHNPDNNDICYYQHPKTRYTWATVHNDDADICPRPPKHCSPPGPGWHVGAIGVATQKLVNYLPLLLSLS